MSFSFSVSCGFFLYLIMSKCERVLARQFFHVSFNFSYLCNPKQNCTEDAEKSSNLKSIWCGLNFAWSLIDISDLCHLKRLFQEPVSLLRHNVIKKISLLCTELYVIGLCSILGKCNHGN